MPDISSLYPAPPQPQQGALSDPSKIAGFIGLAQAAKQFSARQALGRAYQGALQPDGTVDLGQVAQTLKSDPSAAFGLPEAESNILDQHGKMIANDTANFQQYAMQNQFAREGLSALMGKAQNGTLGKEDIYNWATTMSRNSDPRALPSSVLGSVVNNIFNDPKGISSGVITMANGVMGPGAGTARVTGPPTPGGAPTTMPAAAANYPGSMTVGTPPGTPESATTMQSDLVRAGQYSSDIYPLNRALDLAKSLGPGGMGPGSEGRQKFESFVYGLMPQLVPAGMQDKIKNYAELEKYLVNNTQNRAQNLGPHTNQGLATAVTGSPNVQINDLAGVNLIKAQIALRRMEQAQTIQAAKAGPVGYTTAKAGFSASQDPRAYGIDLMSPEQIADLQKNLKGPERARFNSSLKNAIDAGVVTPPGQ